MSNFIKLISFLFLLSSCATPTPYQEANYFGKGYKDQKIDNSKYRISFKGNIITNRETVETYLIYRAAEVTHKEGFSHFQMIDFKTDRNTTYESARPVVYGYYVNNNQRFPYYLYGPPQQAEGRIQRNEYEAVAFITMKKKSKNKSDDLFYNAKEVLENLKSKIKRPKDDNK